MAAVIHAALAMPRRAGVDPAQAAATVAQVQAWLLQHVAADADLRSDSRQVQAGDVLLAWPGLKFDARQTLAQVAALGAGAALVEAQGWDALSASLMAELPEGFAVLPVAGLQTLAGPIAAAWYQHPGAKLAVSALTGTNGKTSVTQWLRQAGELLGEPTAVVGTLGNLFAQVHDDSGLTTPDAVSLQRFLAQAVREGAKALAIEASSIGLDQGRLDGLPIHVAGLTNLTHDHLDYHGDLAAYGDAKALLFAWPGLAAAALNLDDAFGRQLAMRCKAQGVFVFGHTVVDPSASEVDALAAVAEQGLADVLLLAHQLELTPQGQRFVLLEVAAGAVRRASVSVAMLGRHNIENLLTVSAMLRARGVAFEQIAALLPQLVPPPGRLQTLGGDGQPLVVVDYAHTPDALAQALRALRPVAQVRGGKLVVVFGCGGDRDPAKRPVMGQIARDGADLVVVTSDNPRSESPQLIVAQIAATAGASAVLELDRALAISQSVAQADAADVVLIAGKGHEDYQEIAGVRRPFSDVDEARMALARHPHVGASPQGGGASCN